MTAALDGNDSFDPLTLSENDGSDDGKELPEIGKNIDQWVDWRPRNKHERVLFKGLLKPLANRTDE